MTSDKATKLGTERRRRHGAVISHHKKLREEGTRHRNRLEQLRKRYRVAVEKEKELHKTKMRDIREADSDRPG
jgi:hypothetical protein